MAVTTRASEEVWERTALGMVVSSAGGFMDAYSFITQGQVFATGQTGNVVMLALNVAQLSLSGVLHYLAPISAFLVGIIASRWVMDAFQIEHVRMQRIVLLFEAVAFAVLAFLPAETPDLFVNSMISLFAAVTFENFRTFGTSSAYASVFCTGNLRSFAETLYDGISHHDREALGRAFRYLAIVSSFVLGVLLSAGLCHLMGSRSAWGISVLFLLAGHFVSDIERDEEAGRA